MLRTAIGRLVRSCSHEFKRILAAKLRWEQTFTVSVLGDFNFRCASSTELARTIEYGHELISLASFLFMLRPDDVVWDLGASVGLFTVHSASRVRMVVAFEPDPASWRRNQENVALNGLTSKVLFQQIAIGESPGERQLQTDGLEGFAPATVDLGRHSGTVRVRVDTVDRLLASGLPVPTVLKIDIEGAEMLALEGARELLTSSARPRLIFLEVHPSFLPHFGADTQAVTDLLSEVGYKVISTHPRLDQYHILAVAD